MNFKIPLAALQAPLCRLQTSFSFICTHSASFFTKVLYHVHLFLFFFYHRFSAQFSALFFNSYFAVPEYYSPFYFELAEKEDFADFAHRLL